MPGEVEGQRLDLMMVGMNGTDTFREICKLDPVAPVVIVTGYPDSDLMAPALEAGPFAVMKKPFTVAELPLVAENAAARKRPINASS